MERTEDVDRAEHERVSRMMDEPPDEPDDRAPCRKCGAPCSDEEYDGNGGLCDGCTREPCESCGRLCHPTELNYKFVCYPCEQSDAMCP